MNPGAAAAGGAAAAAAAGQNLGQQLVVHPCQTWCSDLARRDPFIGNYAAMDGNYDLALAPGVVRTRIYSSGNNVVPISYLLVVRQVNDPADTAGAIQGHHPLLR